MDWHSIFSQALQQGLGPVAAVYCLAAIGLNVHFGYTGLLNFGQAGFMAAAGTPAGSLPAPPGPAFSPRGPARPPRPGAPAPAPRAPTPPPGGGPLAGRAD